MRTLIEILAIMLFLSSCDSRQKNDKDIHNTVKTSKDISSTKIEVNSKETIEYMTSSYNNPEFEDLLVSQRESFKRLSNSNVFSLINEKCTQTLIEKHQKYFKSKVDYQLLSFANGDLFQESKNDFVFIVYDKINLRISILLYNEITNKYLELFRELKVENGLKDVDCNYSASGTLDYQLADDIVYQEEFLIKKPESYIEYSTPCRIVDISKDKDFVLESGCFSKNVSKKRLSNLLCISTSSVYNNWECLKYDKSTNTFVIIYGQAFAD